MVWGWSGMDLVRPPTDLEGDGPQLKDSTFAHYLDAIVEVDIDDDFGLHQG